jgi:hypothetical protein
MKATKWHVESHGSTASCIMRFPTALGGRNLPTPLAAVCVTVWSHLESCCFDMGGLRELFLWNIKKRCTHVELQRPGGTSACGSAE